MRSKVLFASVATVLAIAAFGFIFFGSSNQTTTSAQKDSSYTARTDVGKVPSEVSENPSHAISKAASAASNVATEVAQPKPQSPIKMARQKPQVAKLPPGKIVDNLDALEAEANAGNSAIGYALAAALFKCKFETDQATREKCVGLTKTQIAQYQKYT